MEPREREDLNKTRGVPRCEDAALERRGRPVGISRTISFNRDTGRCHESGWEERLTPPAAPVAASVAPVGVAMKPPPLPANWVALPS